jgi:hypothetical protein
MNKTEPDCDFSPFQTNIFSSKIHNLFKEFCQRINPDLSWIKSSKGRVTWTILRRVPLGIWYSKILSKKCFWPNRIKKADLALQNFNTSIAVFYSRILFGQCDVLNTMNFKIQLLKGFWDFVKERFSWLDFYHVQKVWFSWECCQIYPRMKFLEQNL